MLSARARSSSLARFYSHGFPVKTCKWGEKTDFIYQSITPLQMESHFVFPVLSEPFQDSERRQFHQGLSDNYLRTVWLLSKDCLTTIWWESTIELVTISNKFKSCTRFASKWEKEGENKEKKKEESRTKIWYQRIYKKKRRKKKIKEMTLRTFSLLSDSFQRFFCPSLEIVWWMAAFTSRRRVTNAVTKTLPPKITPKFPQNLL